MAETWTAPHYLQPNTCAANTYTFSETLTEDVFIRKSHLDELRDAIEEEFIRRDFTLPTWTDDSIVANTTFIKKKHMDELRDATNTLKTGDCSADSYYCPEDTSNCTDYLDSTIIVNETFVKTTHFNEIRSEINSLKTSCICESEYCQYCADCGYSYWTCGCESNSCYCNNEKYSGGCINQGYWSTTCASLNSGVNPDFPTYPLRRFSAGGCGADWPAGGTLTWNGQVPWYMGQQSGGNYYPLPAWNNWSGGYWSCKCTPFTYH